MTYPITYFLICVYNQYKIVFYEYLLKNELYHISNRSQVISCRIKQATHVYTFQMGNNYFPNDTFYFEMYF